MELSFVGSATLNGVWHELVTTLAGHRLWGSECGVWAPRFEQVQDREAAEKKGIRVRSARSSRLGRLRTCSTLRMLALASLWRRHKLLGGLEKGSKDLQSMEYFVCDQGHVSFAEV